MCVSVCEAVCSCCAMPECLHFCVCVCVIVTVYMVSLYRDSERMRLTKAAKAQISKQPYTL